jgi:dTDP-4-dehydrorhamnose 3,5-epimerase
MNVIETKLKGCFIIEPKVFADERGYFVETFNKIAFDKAIGIESNFVQDNESKSNEHVVRGLHFQTGAMAQAKLVRVVQGAVLDVVVDIRKNSPTFLQHISVLLTGENKTQLYVPTGFAHGFSVLQNNTVFNYKCSNFYSKAHEGGINLLDADLNIDWQIEKDKMIISEKDLILPMAKEVTFED